SLLDEPSVCIHQHVAAITVEALWQHARRIELDGAAGFDRIDVEASDDGTSHGTSSSRSRSAIGEGTPDELCGAAGQRKGERQLLADRAHLAPRLLDDLDDLVVLVLL